MCSADDEHRIRVKRDKQASWLSTPRGYYVDVSELPAIHGYIGNKDDYCKYLRQIEGQVRGLRSIVSSWAYCIDIFTQISAVNCAPHATVLGLRSDYLAHWVADAARKGGDGANEKLKKLFQPLRDWFGPDLSGASLQPTRKQVLAK